MRHEDTLSKAELSGLKLFRDNCAQCHKEPLFTDNTYRNTGFENMILLLRIRAGLQG